MSGIPLDTLSVSYSGLALRGITLNYQTPYTQGYNGTVQYQLTQHDSVEAGYVGSQARHLEASRGQNNVTQLLPPGTPIDRHGQTTSRFPILAQVCRYFGTIGNASYNSLQTKWVHQASKGLDLLVGYTLGKATTDAGDSLSGGGVSGYRAPGIVPISYDTGLASFNVTHSFVASGTYQLPVGSGKEYLNSMNRAGELILGGWSVNTILSFQHRPAANHWQPDQHRFWIRRLCRRGSRSEQVQGRNPALLQPGRIQRSAAGGQSSARSDLSPLGGPNTQVNGPGYKDFDFSVFKSFRVTEGSHAEFRAEAFNLTNTPSFNLPTNTDYKDQTNFGQITSTRSSARELQFALKYYW